MLSGNGRHRRPRQAPALIVAAGVTGSAIAIPLLGAASAHAAEGTTWDKVAECESGGSWSANPGTGYYGGLLISQEDWDKYGGTRYAESADEASRSQQIAVAEKILADQGTTPWATCALLAGLTPGSASVDVDPGVGGSDEGDQGNSDAGNSSGSTDASGSGHASDKSELPDSSPSSDSPSKAKDKSAPGASETGDSASDESGTEAPESGETLTPGYGGGRVSDGQVTTAPPVLQESDNSWQTGGSWTLVDTGALSGGKHRGGSADEGTDGDQRAASSGRHATPDRSDYTVREGDTLASIADSLDVHGGWHALYAQNKKSIGADPNDITPGQALNVAAESGGN